MIPIYYIEDLTLEQIDELVERGVVFDIASKTSVLSKNRGNSSPDKIRSNGDKRTDDIRQTSNW